MLKLNDTIAAAATPPGEGGIGIVRVSGPDAFAIAAHLFRAVSGAKIQNPKSRFQNRMLYGRIVDPVSSETIDDAVLLLFYGPRSYTGEDVVEFSCHGGTVTLARVLRLALDAGARAAGPGEFTQRAFLNGKMDLAQAEAVCDQIRARTEAQHRLALRQREGELSGRIAALRDEIVGALAAVEVTIDFSDEVGDLDYLALSERLQQLEVRLGSLLQEGERGRIYREGVRLAIVGRPNVGKSSLMNALLGDERAIVTPIAGTTRDTIEESANIHGIPIIAIDTAGLRETEDVVEQIGVERARAAIETADLLLFVLDAEEGWTSADAAIFEPNREKCVIGVLNKVDRIPEMERAQRVRAVAGATTLNTLAVSAKTRSGMGELEAAIAMELAGNAAQPESVALTNVRHIHALQQARVSVQLALTTAESRMPPDFISIDLRGALDALGRITGETASDEVIHRIFHDFCVGK